MFFTVSGAGGN